jgi:hypothetical protein
MDHEAHIYCMLTFSTKVVILTNVVECLKKAYSEYIRLRKFEDGIIEDEKEDSNKSWTTTITIAI